MFKIDVETYIGVALLNGFFDTVQTLLQFLFLEPIELGDGLEIHQQQQHIRAR